MARASRAYAQPWLERFVLVNLAFLGPDIDLAHSTNSFRHWAEDIPLYFSLAAPVVLLLALAALGLGAPPFAPLLLPNLVLLAFIGLWPLLRQMPAADALTRAAESGRL